MPYVTVTVNSGIGSSSGDTGANAYASQSSVESTIAAMFGSIKEVHSNASAATIAAKLNEFLTKLSYTRIATITSDSSESSESSVSI
jgi:hypothetical protein